VVAPLAASLAAFTLAAGLLTVTPGLDTMLVVRTAAAEGRRPAMLAALGVAIGCLAWGLAVAFGLGALLAASRLAYRILEYAGAAYLIFLGAQAILSKRPHSAEPGAATPRGGPAALRRGLFTNLLNPKVGIFYVSFLPQFVPARMDVAATILLLVSIHILLGLAWFALLIMGTGKVAAALRRPRLARLLDRVTGGVFLLFGLRLALGRD
jgi:threonine/homoserine/homoserine lactone efflux protein